MKKTDLSPAQKKQWVKPEIILLDQNRIHSGTKASAHESHFTPNHTHYRFTVGETIAINESQFGDFVS